LLFMYYVSYIISVNYILCYCDLHDSYLEKEKLAIDVD
jgi:hypothetical protein